MKIILQLVLLAFFTSVFAKDYQILVGAEFGQSKDKWADYTGEWEDEFGIRIGAEADKARIYLSYNYIKTEDLAKEVHGRSNTFESHKVVLNFDAKTDKYYKFLRGFVGGHLGALYSEWDLGHDPARANSKDDTRDDTDFIYGAQAGLIIDLLENAYLEAGLRYSLTNAGSDSINPADIMNYYGAVNFKF